MLEYLEAQMLRGGVPPDQIRIELVEQADRLRERELGDLGHSSISITGDIYGHTSDETARSAVDGWSGALGL